MKYKHSILIAVAVIALSGCSDDKAPTETSVAVMTGEKLFQENCSECHPRTGRGDYLKRIPATLLTRKSQYELMEWIKGSGQHREMPSFEKFTDEERAYLADYLHSQILK
ncbi:MAG: cytochrome c [Porticoccus sp.]|nr:cytochrome c [Porticoccus sp.]